MALGPAVGAGNDTVSKAIAWKEPYSLSAPTHGTGEKAGLQAGDSPASLEGMVPQPSGSTSFPWRQPG